MRNEHFENEHRVWLWKVKYFQVEKMDIHTFNKGRVLGRKVYIRISVWISSISITIPDKKMQYRQFRIYSDV